MTNNGNEIQGVTSSNLPAVPLDGVHEVVVELVLQEDALGVHLHEVEVLKNHKMRKIRYTPITNIQSELHVSVQLSIFKFHKVGLQASLREVAKLLKGFLRAENVKVKKYRGRKINRNRFA